MLDTEHVPTPASARRAKFTREDQQYKSQRAQLSSQYGDRELWSVIDQWPLYCGVANLARCLAIHNIFQETLAVPGHIAEFGCWRGSNLLLLAKLLRIFDPHGCKQVHGFDSFEGLTQFNVNDGDATDFTGKYKGSQSELNDMISLYQMNDEVVLHKGYIEDTLPKLMAAQPELSFSLIYCDVDLYASTKVMLEATHERLCKGGCFVFDEWNEADFPGETLAVREFLREHGDSYTLRHVSQARQPTLILQKTAI